MARHFLSGGKKALSAVSALLAATLLVTSCSTDTVDAGKTGSVTGKEERLPPHGGKVESDQPVEVINEVPVAGPIAAWDTIELMVRTSPVEPEDERFLDDWRFEIFTIDDEARPTSPNYFGETGPDGNALIGLPSYMFQLPLVVRAYNEALPLRDENDDDDDDQEIDDEILGTCQTFEIFIPAYCHDKAIWLLGPFENALWDFYERAARRRAESWNPSQVDCGTWLANMQLLILTDQVSDELHDMNDRDDNDMFFSREVLYDALQENQHLLTPTRPPICMAERRHFGGNMERLDEIIQDDDDFVIDDTREVFDAEVAPDNDPVVISLNTGLVESICDTVDWASQSLSVNGVLFAPTKQFLLDDEDFMGTISDQYNIVPKMDVSTFNTRLGNGREFDNDKYDDACAMTTIVKFTNKDDDEQDLIEDTGVTLFNLFDTDPTAVFLTSDGDSVVDEDDYWAIFRRNRVNEVRCEDLVIAVELIGHREKDFRDNLYMTFDLTSEDLFLGLRADQELNEEVVDGETAYMAYTISVWDGTDEEGREAVRTNISNCYEAADPWARQFFVTQDFDRRGDDCCIDERCEITDVICPLRAAEFAVRSQCFSNSTSNQRWRTLDAGYWSIGTDYGVRGNVIVNAGWLAPHLDFEIFIQKFDEAVFKGPRTVRRTDSVGQLMVELPTLVEGDRVLIRSEDNCCDDYDLVLPCVPEFTGFAGAPGVPYVPVTLGPAPLPPLPVPGPGPGPVPPGAMSEAAPSGVPAAAPSL